MKYVTRQIVYTVKRWRLYFWRLFKGIVLGGAIGLIIFCSSIYIFAKDQTRTIVRVGFPIQEGVSYIDENGEYSGYLVDYLNYVTLFTNWKIEYVQVDGELSEQFSVLQDMLQKGEIDLLGTMRRSRELEEIFLYPSYNYGTMYTTLAVPEDSVNWISEDFSHWDGIRVATYPGFGKNIGLLEQYALVSGFSFQTVNCKTYDEVLDTVRSGKADATLQIDISLEDDLRAIARFAPVPYYFALNKSNFDMLQSLNKAIDNINQAFPYLKSQLYYKYFSYKNTFFISDEEREYLKNLGTIQVLFYKGSAPFQYVKNGKVTGCAYSYINEFANQTGLDFEVVLADTYADKIELIKSGEIDLIAGIPTDSLVAKEVEVLFSMPYLYSYSVLVQSKERSDANISEDSIFRANAEKALQRIKEYPDYSARVDAYSFDFYRQKKGMFENLDADWATSKLFGYSVAVTDHMPEQILVLLNRFAASYDHLDQQNLIYQYATDQVEYTFGEIIYIYRSFIILGVILLILAVRQVLLKKKNKESMKKIAEKEEKVKYLSNFDPLTSAYNERKFRKLISEDCRKKYNRALVAFNIRDFKYINEIYSSSIADRFLCKIKKIFDQGTNMGEYFCRQSADIFYLSLAENVENQVMERINGFRNSIQKESDEMLGGYPINIYCGVTFTSSAPESYSPTAKMSHMLAALSQAKKRVADDFCFYGEMLHETEQTRHYIESHMQSALENGEFKLYLQPKKNLSSDKFDQAEALVRWETNNGKIIFPNQFIPLLEENGFCMQLDLYMVELVCRTLQKWKIQGLSLIGISVNQTKLLFNQDDYVEKLKKITEKYDVSPSLITLELLEGLELDDIETLNKRISELKKLGFHISLDDFGSGYSSLNVLGDLDIDELKVDRAFLMSQLREKNYARRCAIIEQIIQLAKKIDVQTVAEGVETLEDELVIKKLKYDYGQGYYYSKPISVENYRKFLDNC